MNNFSHSLSVYSFLVKIFEHLFLNLIISDLDKVLFFSQTREGVLKLSARNVHLEISATKKLMPSIQALVQTAFQ